MLAGLGFGVEFEETGEGGVREGLKRGMKRTNIHFIPVSTYSKAGGSMEKRPIIGAGTYRSCASAPVVEVGSGLLAERLVSVSKCVVAVV